MYLCCLLPLRDYYPTVMARYSLFVLKVPLNPKQTNKQSWVCPRLQICMCLLQQASSSNESDFLHEDSCPSPDTDVTFPWQRLYQRVRFMLLGQSDTLPRTASLVQVLGNMTVIIFTCFLLRGEVIEMLCNLNDSVKCSDKLHSATKLSQFCQCNSNFLGSTPERWA